MVCPKVPLPPPFPLISPPQRPIVLILPSLLVEPKLIPFTETLRFRQTHGAFCRATLTRVYTPETLLSQVLAPLIPAMTSGPLRPLKKMVG